MELGEKLKRIRKNLKDKTLQEVYEGTNISVSFLSDIERGKTKPSIDTLRKLADYYEVNWSDLLDVNEEEKKIDDTDLYPPGLKVLINDQHDLDPNVIEVMLAMERRAKRKPETKEDWRDYYFSR